MEFPQRWPFAVGRLALVAQVAWTVAACGGYRPEPLTDELVSADLAAPTPSTVQEDVSENPASQWSSIVLDESDGISPDEAAIMAVALNPDLRAARDRLGVAAGQVVQAGILPNPQLEGSLDVPTDGATAGTVLGYGVGLSWDVSELVGRPARRRSARLGADAVELEIAWQEWQVAQEARRHAFRLIAIERRLELTRQAEAVWQQQVERTESGLASGLATALDAASARAGLQAARLQRLRVEQEQLDERLALNAAIGVPPETRLPVDTDLSLPSWDVLPDVVELVEDVTRQRLDLRGLELGYRSEDASFRAATAGAFPSIGLGVNRARDTGEVGSVGVTVSIGLPFFDRNQGQVAIEQATRQQLFDEYLARVRDARNQIAQILGDMGAIKAQIEASQAALPDLEELVATARDAVGSGAMSVVTADDLQQRLITARVDLAALQGDLVELGIALELATGRLLTPPTTPAGPPDTPEVTDEAVDETETE